MKVTKEDIVSIKPGASRMFALEDGKACNSARVLVQYCKRCCLPAGVGGYKTEVDWKQSVVRITAIPE